MRQRRSMEAIKGQAAIFMGHGLVGEVVSPMPAPAACSRVISVLERHGYRPEPMRPIEGHPAWGAPDLTLAACPVCRSDEPTLVLEALDDGTVVWCTNEERCPSRIGAKAEEHVHDFLWAALAFRMPELDEIEPEAKPAPGLTRARTTPKRSSPFRSYAWRGR